MEFKIIRKTGLIGVLINLAVYVNDKKVDTLTNNEELTVSITSNEVEVCVGRFFVKSPSIIVKDGQTVIVKSSLFGSLFSFYGRKSFYLEIQK